MNYILLTELTTNGSRIELNRVETPKGERLEIKSPSSSIRLDAVALEALTWQKNEEFAKLPGADTVHQTIGVETYDESKRTQLTVISNEFGFISIYELRTESSSYVEFKAEKQDESIQLCPSELETLAQQDQNLFTQWIRTDLNEQ